MLTIIIINLLYKPIFNILATSDKICHWRTKCLLSQGIFIPVKRDFPPHEFYSHSICSGEGLMLEMSAFKIFHGGNLTHRHSTTVFLKTRIFFLHINSVLNFSLCKNQGIQFLLGYSKPLVESCIILCAQLKICCRIWMVSIIPELIS